MKLIILIFGVLVSLNSYSAEYEIPVNDRDHRPSDQTQYDHTEYRVKYITCNEQPFGILYKSIWGYSFGSKLIGVCEWRLRNSIDACKESDNTEVRKCFNAVVDRFNLGDKHQKAPLVSTRRSIPLVVDSFPRAAQ